MRVSAMFRVVTAASILLGSAAGCYPHHHGHSRPARDPVVDACLLGACVGATYLGPRGNPGVALAAGATAAALYLAVSDGHHHGHACGCRWRWYRGYRAYHWGGHWEYYENGSWYVIEDGHRW